MVKIMKYYNGIPVGDGVLPGKKTPHARFGSEDCAIFMTYEQWQTRQKKWRKDTVDSEKTV